LATANLFNKKMIQNFTEISKCVKSISKIVLLFLLFFTSCKEQKSIKAQKVKTIIKKGSNNNSTQEKELTPFNPNLLKPNIISQFVRRIFEDSKGNLWLGTNGDGVAKYNGNKLEYFSIKENFGGTAVRGIVEDKTGTVWFATNNGIIKYDGKTFTNFTKKEGLIHNDVWSITIDSSGIIWIGTFQGVCTFNGKKFTPFVLPETKLDYTRGVTSTKIVHSILEDSKKRMWFTTNGGAYIYDGESLTNLSKKDGLPHDVLNDILEDKQGNFWFATHHKGVSKYDGKTFINYTDQRVVKGNEVWSIYEDSKGNIWFPAEGYGVYRFDGRKFINFQEDNGLSTSAVQSIFETADGRLWFGGHQGLFRYDGDSFFSVGTQGPWNN
jgi:ligand-binding sensor domain-containing protein